MTVTSAQFRAVIKMFADAQHIQQWREAIGLIDAAAAEGSAEAIERRAMFECVGVERQPDWNKALESLRQAARLGSDTASRQLALLSEGRTRHMPAARTISANPLIRAIDGFLSVAECQWLIAAAKPRLERAIVYSTATGEQGFDPGRTNQFALFNLVDLDCVVESIRARIAGTIRAPLPCLEVSQVLRYGVAEEFAPHCDYLDPVTMRQEIAVRGQRAATILIYLNDGFEGGQTSFPELDVDYRGSTGDCLIFSNLDPLGRPEPRSRHAGCPPTRGEKWLFSQWVRDRLPNQADALS